MTALPTALPRPLRGHPSRSGRGTAKGHGPAKERGGDGE